MENFNSPWRFKYTYQANEKNSEENIKMTEDKEKLGINILSTMCRLQYVSRNSTAFK